MYVCNVKNVKVLRYANICVMYVCIQDQNKVRKGGEKFIITNEERKRGKREKYTPNLNSEKNIH